MFRWLFPRTVSDIIRRFTTIIEDLEQHASDKIAERERHFATSETYKAYAAEAHKEWDQATTVAGNIKKFLGA